MKEYDAKTKPLLEVFEKMGVLINCEAKKGVKDYPELKKMVEKKLAEIWLLKKPYFYTSWDLLFGFKQIG